MKAHTLLVAAIVPLLLFVSCSSTDEQEILLSSTVKVVKERYAPDRRIAVFDVTWRRSGAHLMVKGEVDHPDAKRDLLNALTESGFKDIVDSIVVLPDPQLNERRFGIVTVSVGNMRTEPSQAAELGTQVMMGSVVKLLKKRGGWYYVQSPDQYLGWLEDDAMALTTPEGVEEWRAQPKVITTAYFGIVREQPSASALPVSDIVVGTLMRSVAERGAWREVALPDGRRGYVERHLVEDYASWQTSRRLSPENIERSAKMFIGVPYLWGGTSPKGVDCSGFTKIVYRMNGLELNRDANQQALMGEEIPLDDDLTQLRKGDLLFFGRKATEDKPERITHVGIYLENKKFIHSSGRVKINSLDPSAPDYDEGNHKRLVRARRVIGSTHIPEVAQR